MPTINFIIPKVLDRQVKEAIRKRGFASKAEFFRMAAFNYLYKEVPEDNLDRLNALTKAVKEEVRRKFAGRRLPSIRKQIMAL